MLKRFLNSSTASHNHYSTALTLLALVCFIVIIIAAAAFRVPRLDLRPVHGDEANQAVKTGILYDTGVYTYDPHEHHGPTLYYFALPILYLSGVDSFKTSDIIHYRALVVFFSLVMMCLLWPLRSALGTGAILWSALFLAVSHGMTYYSRYFVQEILFVCFIQATFVFGWLYLRRPRFLWACLLGVCLGLVHATKETSIIIAFAGLSAIVFAMMLTWLYEGPAWKTLFGKTKPFHITLHLMVAVFFALAVSVTLFSSFFSHARGPLDSLLTYAHYFTRAEGTGSTAIHDKPWYYYLQLLTYIHRQVGPRWSELPVLIAAALGILTALFSRHRATVSAETSEISGVFFKRFLLFYTCITLLIYSLIPYKTPWNLLVFYHGMLLLAGMGITFLIRVVRWRILQTIILAAALAGAGFMARQNYWGNFVYHADVRNPYVYAHPSNSVVRLAERIADISEISGEKERLHINIIRPDGDYWPLPWYLRAYERVGWWTQMPVKADAPIVIAAPQLYDVLKERFKDAYFFEFYALRPGVLLHAHIRKDLWDAFLETRKTE